MAIELINSIVRRELKNVAKVPRARRPEAANAERGQDSSVVVHEQQPRMARRLEALKASADGSLRDEAHEAARREWSGQETSTDREFRLKLVAPPVDVAMAEVGADGRIRSVDSEHSDLVGGLPHESDEPSGFEETSASKGVDGEPLSEEEEQEVAEMKRRDAEVREHEQAHVRAAGPYLRGGPSYVYEIGPDGKRYAVAGEVRIDTAPVYGDAQATMEKARTVQRAALAPKDPSAQDRKVASAARRLEYEAAKQVREENEPRFHPRPVSYEERFPSGVRGGDGNNALASERDVALASEREVALASDREVALASEREVALASDREVALASDREVALASEREVADTPSYVVGTPHVVET